MSIKAYEPLAGELKAMKAHDESITFDYVEDNKAARSHVYKFRQLKTAIDKARKEEKAASLAYGRSVDSEAKALTADVDVIINRHAAPLQAIEDAEKARKDAILSKYNWLNTVATPVDELGNAHGSNYLMSELAAVRDTVADESCGEYLGAVTKAKEAAIVLLEKFVSDAKAREKQNAEMAAIREQQEEAIRIAERKRIEEEGAARAIAKAQADAKAKEEQVAKAAKEADDRAAKAIAKAKADADAKAAQVIKDAKEAEERHARELQAERDEAIRRELFLKLAAEEKENARLKAESDARKEREAAAADKENRERVHDDIAEYLISRGVTAKAASVVVGEIAGGNVPHITVDYTAELVCVSA